MPAATGKGLTPKTFGGLSKTRSASGASAFPRVKLKDDETVSLQFFGSIEDEDSFKEFDQHQWREKYWNYVACLGDDCPLCDDEDDDVSKQHYRFVALVYNHDEKQVQVLEGPGTMAQRIILKAERRPESFVKRTWDVTRLDTTPTSYDIDQSDQKPINLRQKNRLDLQAYIDESAARYFGKNAPRPDKSGKKAGRKSALDDDDEDYDDDEETYTKADLMDMSARELKTTAKQFKVRLVDSSGDKKSKQQVIREILKKQK
jgi:hypothetical protein